MTASQAVVIVIQRDGAEIEAELAQRIPVRRHESLIAQRLDIIGALKAIDAWSDTPVAP